MITTGHMERTFLFPMSISNVDFNVVFSMFIFNVDFQGKVSSERPLETMVLCQH